MIRLGRKLGLCGLKMLFVLFWLVIRFFCFHIVIWIHYTSPEIFAVNIVTKFLRSIVHRTQYALSNLTLVDRENAIDI